MDLDFDLQLTDRQPDRVLVSVLLRPAGAPVTVDGVAVMLVCPDGEPLSHRMLLPIAGTLTHPMASTVELRGHEDLPAGTRIVGYAWGADRQWEARIPADPGTQMAAHCCGRVTLRPYDDRVFADHFLPLSDDEREALAVAYPWLAPRHDELTVVDDDTVDDDPCFRSYCEGLGLDDDDTDWLQDLLNE